MDIQSVINDAFRQEDDRLTAWMIEVFGSLEQAIAAMRYFVIEETPPRFSVDDDPTQSFMRYRVDYEYRIRPKTPEELSHDRAEEILAMNTRDIPICIVCREPIGPNETLVDTIHGKYHGFPKDCINGHPD